MEKSILETIHETAKGLNNIKLMDEKTLQEFNLLCSTPIKEYSAEQIKEIRLKNNLTQAVFATYFNLTLPTIQKWEKGLTKPKGSSLKLLNLLEKNGVEILKI